MYDSLSKQSGTPERFVWDGIAVCDSETVFGEQIEKYLMFHRKGKKNLQPCFQV